MLYNVAAGIQAMTQTVIRNHPSSLDVQILRKEVTRPADTGEMGGLPNFGGLGVLDSQDEVSYSYAFLCNGHALKAEPFQPGNMTDRGDAPIGGLAEFVYMLAPVVQPEEVGLVQIKTKDVVLFVLGQGQDAARLAYEVVSVDATCELPPFMPRYVLNRRGDLDLPAGFLTVSDDGPGNPVSSDPAADGSAVVLDD